MQHGICLLTGKGCPIFHSKGLPTPRKWLHNGASVPLFAKGARHPNLAPKAEQQSLQLNSKSWLCRWPVQQMGCLCYAPCLRLRKVATKAFGKQQSSAYKLVAIVVCQTNRVVLLNVGIYTVDRGGRWKYCRWRDALYTCTDTHKQWLSQRSKHLQTVPIGRSVKEGLTCEAVAVLPVCKLM